MIRDVLKGSAKASENRREGGEGGGVGSKRDRATLIGESRANEIVVNV